MTSMVTVNKRITSQASEDGTSFVTQLTLTAAELAEAGFAANDEVGVLLFVNVEAESNNEVQTQLTYDGNALGPDSGLIQYDLGTSGRQRSYTWMDFVDLGGTIGDFDLDLASSSNGLDAFINKAELIVFLLADLGEEGVDWHRDTSTTAVAHTDAYSATSRASITWTPDVVEDWIALGSLAVRVQSVSLNHEGRFALDGTPTAGDWSEEGESLDENKRWLWFDQIDSLSAAPHTLAIETRDDALGTQNDHTQSNLLVFRKNRFRDIFVDEPGNVILPANTDTQLAEITDSVSEAQDAILLGHANANLDFTNRRGWIWVEKDGVVIDPVVDRASDLAAVHLSDDTDEPHAAVIAAFAALDEGVQDLDLIGNQTGPNRTYIDVKFLVWGTTIREVGIGRRIGVGTSATEIIPADARNTYRATVRNNGSADIDLGDASVAAGAGFPLAAGESIRLKIPAGVELHGVVSSGTEEMHVLEVVED